MKTQKSEDQPVDDIDNGVNPAELSRKKAFFITPLGSEDSTVRRNTNGIINAVIRPVLEESDIVLIPPHEIDNPGNITKQIIREILTAELVIADLTGLNANVMYELAVRHAKRLPVIVIAQVDTKLPFDIAAERTIFYQNDMAGVVHLTEQLRKTIPKALEDKKPDNPIYNGLESLSILEKVEKNSESFDKYILEKLDQLTDSVSYLRNGLSFNKPTDEFRIIAISLRIRLNLNEAKLLKETILAYNSDFYQFSFIQNVSNSLTKGIRFKSKHSFSLASLANFLKDKGFDVAEVVYGN